MEAYQIALDSQADCIEIDVSRSSDGVLFALHDRYVGLKLRDTICDKTLVNICIVPWGRSRDESKWFFGQKIYLIQSKNSHEKYSLKWQKNL